MTVPPETSTSRQGARQVGRFSVNVVGALIAAYFARRYLLFYVHSHRLIGVAFFTQQMWIMTAFLVRRSPRIVSRRFGDWALAFFGTFGGVLLEPSGAHLSWALDVGFGLQLVGLAISAASLLVLGRSFGSVAANRGIVERGPYSLVRHPLYTGYLLIQVGYVLQSFSWWNVLVVLFVTGCNVGRALVEESLLATTAEYEEYQGRVRWRFVTRIW